MERVLVLMVQQTVDEQTIVVCHNTSRYLSLHYEQVLRDLMNHYRVVCVAPRDGYENRLEETGAVYEPISINQHGMNPFQELRFIADLYGLYRKYRPAMAFNFSIKPCLYGSIAARLAGIKKVGCMVTGLGYVFLTESTLAKAIRVFITLLYRVLLRKGDVMFFQNPDDASLFDQLGISRRCKTVILPGTGIDTVRFNADPPSPTAQAVQFLFIGRMLKDKGIREYYEAARRLKKQYQNVRFRLLGPMDDNPSAVSKDEILTWQEEGVVEYMGETDDVRPYILQSHVFVLPSYREGLPRAGLEAMAMSRPVITTDTPGCRELVIEGENGYLVEPRSADSLADAMEIFIHNPELCVSMGIASRRYCRKFFAVEQVSRQVLEAITEQEPGNE